MPIVSYVDLENNLTIFKAENHTESEEFLKAVQSFYQQKPSLHVLWIINERSVWNLTGKHIKDLALFSPRFDQDRQGAKTAIVAPDELSKSLSQLFVHIGDSNKLPIKLKLFKHYETAMAWIKNTDG